MRAGVGNSGQKGFGSSSPPWSVDSDETRAERANMLAEFEEKAEDERCMHCLKLAQFAE